MRHALLIAIDRFLTLRSRQTPGRRSALEGAVYDLQRLGRVLEERGFAVQRLYEGWARRDKILQTLDALVEVAQPGDSVVLAWAGAGSWVQAEEWSRGFRSLVTVDSDHDVGGNRDLLEPELLRRIEALEAKPVHLTSIFDLGFERPDVDDEALGSLRAEAADRRPARKMFPTTDGTPAVEVVQALEDFTKASGEDAQGEDPQARNLQTQPWLADPPGAERRSVVLTACEPGGRAFEVADPKHPEDPQRRVGRLSHALVGVFQSAELREQAWEQIDWNGLFAKRLVPEMVALVDPSSSAPPQEPAPQRPGLVGTHPPELPTPGSVASESANAARRLALVVGVGRYRLADHLEATRLGGAVHDAVRLAEYLQGRGFEVDLRLDAEATRAGLVAAFDRLEQATQAGDSVVFAFSGHGSFARQRAVGLRQSLVPYDSGRRRHGTANRDFFDLEVDLWVKRLNRKGIEAVTLIFDSCHSGGASRSTFQTTDLDEGVLARLVPGEDLDAAEIDADGVQGEAVTGEDLTGDGVTAPLANKLAKLARESSGGTRSVPGGAPTQGWVRRGERVATVVTACGEHQQAIEKFSGGLVQGVFSRFLVDALEAHAATPWEALDWRSLVRDTVQTADFRRVLGRHRQRPRVEVPGLALDTPLKTLRRLALVIGIEGYEGGLPRLQAAIDDAQAVGRELERQGYEVMLLTDDPSTPEATPTGARIRSALAQLRDAMDDPSVGSQPTALVFYFAGHGVAETRELAEVEGFLLAQDAELKHPRKLGLAQAVEGSGESEEALDSSPWISMEELRQTFRSFDCHHLLVVLDCCFAGAFNLSRSLPPRHEPLFESQLRRFLDHRAWQVLTSASHLQLARDVRLRGVAKDGPMHSPFTAALLEGLRGAADPGLDGVITATDLFVHLQNALHDVPGGQMPGLSHFDSQSTGQFVFLDPDREPKPLPDPSLSKSQLPWRGFEPYDRGDAERFFGFEGVIDELVGRLRPGDVDQVTPRLLAVVAPSGGGKTSLLQAGLLPRLQPHFEIVELSVDSTASIDRALEVLASTSSPPESASAPASPTDSQPRLLVVDGLEALFDHPVDHRLRFLHALGSEIAVTEADRKTPAKALVTSRTDFVSRATELFDVAVEVVRLPTPDLDGLRRIIEGPAQRYGLFVEPSLVDTLVVAAHREPWPLPSLSATLEELYLQAFARWSREGPDRELRRSDLVGGGVGAVLHRRAQSALEAEAPEDQAELERLFVRLVDDAGGGRTKQRVARHSLHTGDPARDPRIDAVLDRWIALHLLVEGEGDSVTVASNALLEGWGQLGRWLDAEPVTRGRLRELERAVGEWVRAGHDDRLLWHTNPQLVGLGETARRWFNSEERAFVALSERERENLRLDRVPEVLVEESENGWSRALGFALALHRARPESRVAGRALRRCLGLTPLSLGLESPLPHSMVYRDPGCDEADEVPTLGVGWVEVGGTLHLAVRVRRVCLGWRVDSKSLGAEPISLDPELVAPGSGAVGDPRDWPSSGEPGSDLHRKVGAQTTAGSPGVRVWVHSGVSELEVEWFEGTDPEDSETPEDSQAPEGSEPPEVAAADALPRPLSLLGLEEQAGAMALEPESRMLAVATLPTRFYPTGEPKDPVLQVRLWTLRSPARIPRWVAAREATADRAARPAWVDTLDLGDLSPRRPECWDATGTVYATVPGAPGPDHWWLWYKPQTGPVVELNPGPGRSWGNTPDLVLSPGGSWLATILYRQRLLLWSLGPSAYETSSPIEPFDLGALGLDLRSPQADGSEGDWMTAVTFDGTGSRMALALAHQVEGGGLTFRPEVWAIDLEAREPLRVLRPRVQAVEVLGQRPEDTILQQVAFGTEGRWVAAAPRRGPILVWDLDQASSLPTIELPGASDGNLRLEFEEGPGETLRVEGEMESHLHSLDLEPLLPVADLCLGAQTGERLWGQLMLGEPLPRAPDLDPETRRAAIEFLLGLKTSER